MVTDNSWTDPDTWEGVTVWILFAFTPLLVFLPCVLQPDVDVGHTVRRQWYYSTEIGAHRILAEWHTFWLGVACSLSGVAQFLAWREDNESWHYPTTMLVFYAAVLTQWAWIAAYFRLVNRFTTGRNFLFLAFIVNIALACLYAPLHKLSTVLVLVRVVLHDLPMLIIAIAAVRIHRPRDEYGLGDKRWGEHEANSDEDHYNNAPPTPKRPRGRQESPLQSPLPPVAAPPRRTSVDSIIELLGFNSPSRDESEASASKHN